MNNQYESIPLSEWVEEHSNEDDLRFLFLNLDMALKYIHEHGYCVDVFYPTMIEILDNQPNYIRFRKLIELSKDPARRREMIREDIFRSSFIQIGIYSNSLKYLKPDFLKENFDSFIQFIPSGDVPYYRGIIQRNAMVYFSEYDLEKRNRDLINLDNQINDNNGEGRGHSFVKRGNAIGVEPISNDRINDSIYRQINGLNDSAFVHALIVPALSLFTLFMFGLLAWIIGLFA